MKYAEIPGFPGYRAGLDGSVWSAWKLRGRGLGWEISERWKKLKPSPRNRDRRNYYALRRGLDRKSISRSGAQWVLLAFVSPCPDGMESCHNNGDCLNDSLVNVRYDTHLANMRDSVAHGTRPHGEHSANAKLNDSKVREIRSQFAAGGITKESLGAKYGVCGRSIGDIVRRKIWQHVE